VAEVRSDEAAAADRAEKHKGKAKAKLRRRKRREENPVKPSKGTSSSLQSQSQGSAEQAGATGNTKIPPKCNYVKRKEPRVNV
jgi:hypothetical protein